MPVYLCLLTLTFACSFRCQNIVILASSAYHGTIKIVTIQTIGWTFCLINNEVTVSRQIYTFGTETSTGLLEYNDMRHCVYAIMTVIDLDISI